MGLKIIKRPAETPAPARNDSTVRQVQFSPIAGDRVMGLDISTKTGVVVLDGAEKVVLAREVTVMDREAETVVDRMLRLKVLQENIEHEIKRTRPAFIAIEGYGYANIYTLATLVEIGAVVRLTAYQHKIPFIEVTPLSLKKYACGNHKAKKDQVRLGVYKQWGFEHDSDNVVDAYALAQVARAFKGLATGLNVPQREVLGTLRSKKQQFLDPETEG